MKGTENSARRNRERHMKVKGILIDPADHVVTLSAAVKAGEKVSYLKADKICCQTAAEDIPKYHKMAIIHIDKGQRIMKYGEQIGTATKEITAGGWVHIHNLQSAGLVSEKVTEAGTDRTICGETKKERL